MELRRILVGVDFRPPSLRAAQWAAELAGPEGRIELVTVLPGRQPPLAPPSGAASGTHATRRRAMDGLEGFASTLDCASVGLHVRVGEPVRELCALADSLRADLLVLGRHLAGGSGGRTRERLLRHVRVPVLVVGARGTGAPRRVLAALDDAGLSERVLDAARFMARRADGELAVAHVLARPARSPLDGDAAGGGITRNATPIALDDTEDRSAAADAATGAHAWLLAQVTGSYLDRRAGGAPPARTVVLRGEPGAQLLSYAQRHPVDLLVVGRNGRHAAGPTELGTATRLLARAAPVPVLVVPPGRAPRPERPAGTRAADGRRVHRREVVPVAPPAPKPETPPKERPAEWPPRVDPRPAA